MGYDRRVNPKIRRFQQGHFLRCVKQSRTHEAHRDLGTSRMAGSINPADTRASIWATEMSQRIDILPSRRRPLCGAF